MEALSPFLVLAQAAPKLTSAALRVGLALGTIGQQIAAQNVKIQTLATAAGLNPGTVRRALVELSRAGVLVRRRTGRGVSLAFPYPVAIQPLTEPDRALGAHSAGLHNACTSRLTDTGALARNPLGQSDRARRARSDRAPRARSDRAPRARSREFPPPLKNPPPSKPDTPASSSSAPISAPEHAAAAAPATDGSNQMQRHTERSHVDFMAAMASPIADFLRGLGIADEDLGYTLRFHSQGELLADLIAAHRSPPLSGELGVVDLGRAVSSIREHWGKWSLEATRAALADFGEPERSRLAALATPDSVALARRLVAQKIAAGVNVRSQKGLIRAIIKSGEAASELIERTRKQANSAARAKVRTDAAALAAVGARELAPNEIDVIKTREAMESLSDSELSELWPQIVKSCNDEKTRRNLSRAHYAEANGHLRTRILEGAVARQVVATFLERLKHGNTTSSSSSSSND